MLASKQNTFKRRNNDGTFCYQVSIVISVKDWAEKDQKQGRDSYFDIITLLQPSIITDLPVILIQ